MSDDSLGATRNRLVAEGEHLVVHSVSTGSLDLVSVAAVRHNELALRRSHKSTFWQRIARCFEFEKVPDGSHPVSAVWVPSGTHLILKGIPTSLQQRYGLEEEEGAIYLRHDTEDGTSRGKLRFNNGHSFNFKSCERGSLWRCFPWRELNRHYTNRSSK